MELVPRIEEDAEEGVTKVAVDDRLQLASRLSDVQCFVPLGHGGEVRNDEAVDVILDSGWQLRRVLDDEAGTAVERSPNTKSGRQWIATFDAAITRAEQSEASERARPSA